MEQELRTIYEITQLKIAEYEAKFQQLGEEYKRLKRNRNACLKQALKLNIELKN